MQKPSIPHILLIGAGGQLGVEITKRLGPAVKLSKAQTNGDLYLDLSKPESIRASIMKLAPDMVINCAAYTAVDKAEAEPLLAQAVNGESPKIIAECCHELGIRLIHFSTDYVYDGNLTSPIGEDCPTKPLNEYGRSKLLGDIAISSSGCEHIIFRTSWVYAAHGHNFLKTMLKLSSERDELRIVDDQIGSPTWTGYLANETVRVTNNLLSGKHQYASGVYNMTCSGETSWYGFAEEIFKVAESFSIIQKIPNLISVSSDEYPTPAQRPHYSVLNTRKAQELLGSQPLAWQEALKNCLKSYG